MEFTSRRSASLDGLHPVRDEAVVHHAPPSNRRKVNYTEAEVIALLTWWAVMPTDRKDIIVRYADLAAAVDQLPEDLRLVVLYYGTQQYTQHEVGKALGIHRTTVSTRWAKAVALLVELINGNPSEAT